MSNLQLRTPGAVEVYRRARNEDRLELVQRLEVQRRERVAGEKVAAAGAFYRHAMHEGSFTISFAESLVDDDPVRAKFLGEMTEGLTATLKQIGMRLGRELDSI